MPTSFLHVASVRHLGGHRLVVTFTGETDHQVDFRGELNGEVFEPLRGEAAFAEAFVDEEETRTVAWPNEADLAPEFLYEIGQEVETASTR